MKTLLQPFILTIHSGESVMELEIVAFLLIIVFHDFHMQLMFPIGNQIPFLIEISGNTVHKADS